MKKNKIVIGMSLFLMQLTFSSFASEKLMQLSGFERYLESDSTAVIVDVRKPDEFLAGHIPNALNIWRPDFTDTTFEYSGMMASKEEIKKLLSDLGVRGSDKIIIYDEKGDVDAARFKWILMTYGHENSVLLDGGFKAWKAAGGEISTEIVVEKIADYQFHTKENYHYFATIEDVKRAIKDSNTILLDVRTLEEYLGNIQKKGAFRKGRIPRSIHLDWANSVNYDGDRKFKTNKELTALFESKGVTKDKKIIAYCHSGVRSAHTTFVLSEILGYKEVKNYDGSWIEWSYHKELSTETGEFKNIESSSYWSLFIGSFSGYASYLWSEITFQTDPWYQNYFWWLIVLSIVVWLLELAFPWRKDQAAFRQDFWIDAFYMFFNFFIFNLIIFIAFSKLTTQVVKDIFGGNLSQLAIVDLQDYPQWLQLLIFFIATDFIQWFTHVLLHRFDILWQFHKVHHSVQQMGFAAHLRYHWMENVFYTPMKYIMVMLLGGFVPAQAFIIYYVAIAIGHFNHANLAWNYGPLKYIINNPKMHIWHHAYEMPETHPKGANFGISLSIWDYIFRTNYVPQSGRDIKLGFPSIEKFPTSFFKQLFYGFRN